MYEIKIVTKYQNLEYILPCNISRTELFQWIHDTLEDRLTIEEQRDFVVTVKKQ